MRARRTNVPCFFSLLDMGYEFGRAIDIFGTGRKFSSTKRGYIGWVSMLHSLEITPLDDGGMRTEVLPV
jgi:hypothetical protein